MKKDQLVHLHHLIYEVADFIEDEIPQEKFVDYWDLEIGPNHVNSVSSDHKEAVYTILGSVTDLLENGEEGFYDRLLERSDLSDDGRIKALAHKYMNEGYGRMEAAEQISELVEYTTSTVNEKFVEMGVKFGHNPVDNGHGEEIRDYAINTIEELAESGQDRRQGLEQLSEEVDVPFWTLKLWMNQEQIKFEDPVAAIMSEEDKEELIKTAEHYFDTRNNLETMEQALDKNKATLRAYKNGQIETVPLELLENLDSLFGSEPRYRMDDPGRYTGDENWRGIEVNDDFQEFLFQHLNTDEFEGMTGKSEGTFNKYRNNKTEKVDAEAYRKAFQAVSYMYEKVPDIEVDEFVDKHIYSNNGGKLAGARLEPDLDEDFDLL